MGTLISIQRLSYNERGGVYRNITENIATSKKNVHKINVRLPLTSLCLVANLSGIILHHLDNNKLY